MNLLLGIYSGCAQTHDVLASQALVSLLIRPFCNPQTAGWPHQHDLHGTAGRGAV